MGTRINVAELLKNCPSGMKLDCAMFENLYFDYIDDSLNNPYPILCYGKTNEARNVVRFSKYGTYTLNSNAKCVIYPKGKTTWEGFIPPFKDGDIVAATLFPEGLWIGIFKQYEGTTFEVYCSLDTDGEFHNTYSRRHALAWTRLATEEEKKRLFQAIKDNGYKWDAERKCLIELPKFKDGDILAAGDWVFIFKELHTNGSPRCYCHYDLTLEEFKVDTNSYMACGGDIYLATKEQQDLLFSKMEGAGYKWNGEKKCLEKLEKERFDISTLKPYDKVLARFGNKIKWFPAEFGLYNEEDKLFVLAGGYAAKQCIPFEGNEHLRGKRDDCDEFYKTWED